MSFYVTDGVAEIEATRISSEGEQPVSVGGSVKMCLQS
jgi:hypothetical protein